VLTSITGWHEEHTDHGWGGECYLQYPSGNRRRVRSNFPLTGQDLEVVEDCVNHLGQEAAGLTLTSLWQRPIPKEDVQGIHGTLFYDWQSRAKYLPASRREVDRDAGQLNEWQRHLYDRLRTNSEK
jgi:hypothetical protein